MLNNFLDFCNILEMLRGLDVNLVLYFFQMKGKKNRLVDFLPIGAKSKIKLNRLICLFIINIVG